MKPEIILIRIPRVFLDDHAERDLPTPVIQKTERYHYRIRADDPALPELVSDAAHYAGGRHLHARLSPPLRPRRVRPRDPRRHPQITRDLHMTQRIALQSKPSPQFYERHNRWQVLLNGEPWGDPFYYNMRGYRGALPLPDGRSFDPGEVTLTQLRQEVARINREAREAASARPAADA